MVLVLSFFPLISVFAVFMLTLASQNYSTIRFQEHIKQAQLASVTAMDFAKEQYELDQSYNGTAETTLYETATHRVAFEVVSRGYTNPSQTQQDIQGFGRVYERVSGRLVQEREIQGKITYTSGTPQSVRFVFIIDNSGSMSESEWLQSKETADASIEYVLDNAPTAEVAVVQYGTNDSSHVHKYDVTVPFTKDPVTATTWDRRYGPGSPSVQDYQDHLPASLAEMRMDSVYGPGDALDLAGASNVQFVLFTDAYGERNSGGCCTSLKKASGEPSNWNSQDALSGYGEYNQLKDGTVFADDGYSGLTSGWTVLSVYDDDNNINTTSYGVLQTRRVSAAIASVGGDYDEGIDDNSGDPEGDGILPRKFIYQTLSAGPDEIISLLQQILEKEINI